MAGRRLGSGSSCGAGRSAATNRGRGKGTRGVLYVAIASIGEDADHQQQCMKEDEGRSS